MLGLPDERVFNNIQKYGNTTAATIPIALNETIWAGAIVLFAVLAVVGLGFAFARHRHAGPLLLGGLGAAVLTYAMYGHYTRLTELAGFALLCLAALWDWRLRRKST
jgi:lipopolysaccharide export LptBFGC system permease protein LptF